MEEAREVVARSGANVDDEIFFDDMWELTEMVKGVAS